MIYSESVPASGFYGIYVDDETFTPKFEIDNVSGHLYNWDNTVKFTSFYPPFEGKNVLSFKSSGAQSWYGFGIYSDQAVNLLNFKDGYLNISMITQSAGDFYIGMDADDGSGANIDFKGSSGPYGFQRDGTWQHLSIPMSDLLAKGLNLSQVKHVFKTGGGSIGDIAFDRIFLSAEEQEAPVGIHQARVEPWVITAFSDGADRILLKGIKPGSSASAYLLPTVDGSMVFRPTSEELVIPISSYQPGIYIVSSVLREFLCLGEVREIALLFRFGTNGRSTKHQIPLRFLFLLSLEYLCGQYLYVILLSSQNFAFINILKTTNNYINYLNNFWHAIGKAAKAIPFEKKFNYLIPYSWP